MHRIIHSKNLVVNTLELFVYNFCNMPYLFAYTEEFWLKCHVAIHGMHILMHYICINRYWQA